MKRLGLFFGLIGLLSVLGIDGGSAADIPATCAQGGICQLGDIGPGGGMVFYIRNEKSFAVWKATPNAEGDFAFSDTGWHYLEVAPKSWAGGSTDPKLNWCSNTNIRAAWVNQLQGWDWYHKWVPGKTQSGFLAGTGFGNSDIFAQNCKTGAATSARKYRGGGKTDWYLPRQTELNQLAFFAGGILDPNSACCIADFPKRQSSTFASSAYAVNWGNLYWVSTYTFGKLANQWQGPDRMSLGSNAPGSGLPFARPIRAF